MGVLDSAINAVSAPFEDGNRLNNAVTVLVGSNRVLYDAWENININRSFDQIAGGFSLTMLDKWRESFEEWPIVPGEEVLVNIGTDSVIRGFVDKLDVSVGKSSRTMKINGRDLTGDLVDTSVPGTPNEYRNLNILQMARILLEPFNIPLAINVSPGLPFETITVRQGESVFDLLHRLAQLRGLVLQSVIRGALLITDRSTVKVRSGVSLIQGGNILAASGVYDYTERFNTYIVKGQARGTDFTNRKTVSQPTATAIDKGIRSTRQKIIIADGPIDVAAAQKRANWEATVQLARSTAITIKVQGWRQNPLGIGPLWEPNQLVTVRAPFIGQQDGEFLITGVHFHKSGGPSAGGTVTNLRLTNPDAYIPDIPLDPDRDKSKNLGWKIRALQVPQ